jgi:hypothetical protein
MQSTSRECMQKIATRNNLVNKLAGTIRNAKSDENVWSRSTLLSRGIRVTGVETVVSREIS